MVIKLDSRNLLLLKFNYLQNKKRTKVKTYNLLRSRYVLDVGIVKICLLQWLFSWEFMKFNVIEISIFSHGFRKKKNETF